MRYTQHADSVCASRATSRLVAVLAAVLTMQVHAAEDVLFKDNFSGLHTFWEIVDDPQASAASQWRVGIAELSGIYNDNKFGEEVATMLLAGDESWENYCVETTLFCAEADGYLTGLIFGFQDPQHFYQVGYNFDNRRFELKCRIAKRFQKLAQKKLAFPEGKEIPIRLDFARGRIRFTANEHVIFDLEDATYQRGRFGLGTADLGSAKVLIGPVTVRTVESSQLPPPVDSRVKKLSDKPREDAPKQIPQGSVLFQDNLTLGDLGKWEVYDNQKSEPKHSLWRIVVSDCSGILTSLNKAATFLLVGESDWRDYVVQTDLVAAGGDGHLSGIVFGYQDLEHFYHAGYNFSTDRFELERRAPHGFEMLAFAEMELPRGRCIPLQLTFVDQRIQFRANGQTVFDLESGGPTEGRTGIASSGLDEGRVAFHGFQVHSYASGSLPPREMSDLLAFREGAAVIYRTAPPASDSFEPLIDHSLTDNRDAGETCDLDLSETELPEEAVFAFPQGRFVEIHQVGIKLDEEDFPKQIKLWVSDRTPKTGFQPLATIKLKKNPESHQKFRVQPTMAKYLKLQVVEGYGDEEICIPEIYVRGYFKQSATLDRSRSGLEAVELEEQEPNDTLEMAQSLPLEVRLGAKAGEDDVDYYRLSPAGATGDTLVVDLDHIGIVRPECRLFSSGGQEIPPARTELLSTGRRLEYAVAPSDHYYLRIHRPETYLTIVYDDSGSMGTSVRIVKRVLQGYLDRLGSRLNIKLVTYADKPKDLCDFTHDVKQLEAALKGRVGIGGGTNTFSGLMRAIDSVKDRQGNRAVIAIFDVIDGAAQPLKQYIQLWDSILDAGVSFTTIGVQSGWDDRTDYFGNSRQRIFREIAYASQGEFHHAPSDSLVERSANRIFEQLTTPTQYSVRAHWKTRIRRPGWIQVAFAEGTGAETARNVELILDASYSMCGEMDRTSKIAVARQILQEVIQKLPQNIHVGLRVFGHRYGSRDQRTNTDTEFVFPLGPLDRSRLVQTINQIDPRGKTPLVHSILQAQQDFREIGRGTLIVVTDGLETCGGDINSIGPALKKSGLELRVNVVGFGIEDLDARQQLESIARSTGGRYLDAGNPGELLASLQETLNVEFVVLDHVGVEQARGLVGGDLTEVPDGRYTLRLQLEDESLETSIVVRSGETDSFLVEKPADRWMLRAK